MMRQLTVYTRPNCGFCTSAKNYLSNLEIQFSEVNVQEDEVARQRLLTEGHRTLPVILAGEEVMYGGWKSLRTMRKEEIISKLNS